MQVRAACVRLLVIYNLQLASVDGIVGTDAN